ncbi:hypothetical protein MKW98_003182 [Papaver atlanticum]|uniref:Uncharacterized protein n=1 Tax=Papaver atlanticum TaxID=357466 RepID=A0AAD4THH3_9MAGN|nr:hypothetical protein MKW98_003182 [Papaver atlanticum]
MNVIRMHMLLKRIQNDTILTSSFDYIILSLKPDHQRIRNFQPVPAPTDFSYRNVIVRPHYPSSYQYNTLFDQTGERPKMYSHTGKHMGRML